MLCKVIGEKTRNKTLFDHNIFLQYNNTNNNQRNITIDSVDLLTDEALNLQHNIFLTIQQ